MQAHSDDIEIGCGGTLLHLIETGTPLHVEWCVLSGNEQRRAEAEASARDFARHGSFPASCPLPFADSYFPAESRAIKEWLIAQRGRGQPDIVFTHYHGDAHQDHRTVNELTWNLFRDQLILEYEIPKWDGDLGRPDAYSALPRLDHGAQDRSPDEAFWHTALEGLVRPGNLPGLARLRGMECRAPETYAEAFHARKLRLF
ncbi:PIG-L deacetylase family protein [Brucella abortus]|nr:PIG-L deacetylase family protein [Brucella abortus]